MRSDAKPSLIASARSSDVPSPARRADAAISSVVRHQMILAKLYDQVAPFVLEHGLGLVLFAPVDVVFNERNALVPDLLLLSPEQVASAEKYLDSPPPLVVEVLSPSTRRRDELKKRRLYERFGVQEYWIADPDTDRVRVYRRPAPGEPFGKVLELAAEHGERLTSPLLPGLEVDLGAVFEPPAA